MTSKKHCLPQTTGLIHTWTHRDRDNIHKTHTGLNETKIPALRRESGQNVPPLSKEVFATDTFWKKENKFSSLQYTEYINHTLMQAPCSGVVSEHKRDSIFFLWAFCFVLLFPVPFPFFCVKFVCFDFCLGFVVGFSVLRGGRKRICTWVGSGVG